MLKGHDSWHVHSEVYRVKQLLSSSITYELLYSRQTLITLDLEENDIGTEGAKHLAHALQSNRVGQLLSLRLHITELGVD
jgi:hypothetical protein